MRRATALALALAIALPLCAQSGARAGFAAHPAGPVHSSPSFRAPAPGHPPMRFSGAPGRYALQPRTGPQFFHQPPHGISAMRPGFYQKPHPGPGHRGDYYRHGGAFFSYPVVIGPGYWPYGYSPFFDYDLDNGFMNDPDQDQVYNNLSNDGVAPQPPAPNYQASPDSYPAPPQTYAAPPPPAPSPEMQYVPGSADKITLIFKDGRPPEEIENYLATPSTITVIDGHHRREIRVADLDVPATIKANRQTGVDFQLPKKR